MTRWLLVAFAVTACSPVLEPVVGQTPQALTAQASPSRVLWVLDNSGSLLQPTDPTSPACPAGCGASSPCPAACETRKAMLLAGLDDLAAQLPPSRHGAVLYPTDSTCGAPTAFFAAVPAAASTSSWSDIARVYAARSPLGGTPTGAALQFLTASLPDEPASETFAVLVTDGLPNCNAANPNHQCAGPSASCRCTTTTCAATLCALGCLDDLGTIDASRALARRGVKLMVVGLGADVLVEGAAMLSSLEIALPRQCSTSADCRAGTSCTPSGLCAERFYAVSSVQDFAKPARRIADAVNQSRRCSWWLEHEVVAGDLSVALGGRALSGAEWSLEGSRRVRLGSAGCDELLADEALAPSFLWRPGAGQ